MVESNKQVRVDNWGTFFLQRLQVFFAKTDYCDLTLQFDGNVQLKVHRLVMNACTEYFRFLEESCPALEENTILMPADLQSDVIVPIVNFMYTGMLEFHISLFNKLYKAAELMNISILTKLLEAQKLNIPTKSSQVSKPKPEKRPTPARQHQSFAVDLPSPLPGRKLPVWKRKTASATSTPINTTPSFEQQKWHTPIDPLSTDNTPKPTRFEWPEDDLPSMTMLDTSFDDISYTSKPLLTREEEDKIKPNFDDLRNNVELPPKRNTGKSTSNVVNFSDIEEFSKQQKIRTAMFEDIDEVGENTQKRKAEMAPPTRALTKKIKISNKENKETTISVESNTPGEIDHTKIVTEILKKYPDLVKKNKNIKLKIMPGNKETEKKAIHTVETIKRQPENVNKLKSPVQQFSLKRRTNKIDNEGDEEGPWVCRKCISSGGEVQEFVLYYLYRKHMTVVHDEVFDARSCKYCGRKCNSHTLMMYHMYTKHALKPPASFNFPKCDKCPYIGFDENRLNRHKLVHSTNEMQCQDCKLGFTSPQTLTSHIRITGHFNKPGRISYDCQYCMKKLQSALTLLSHIRSSHLPEGRRDGIVCLDELESIEDLFDFEETGDEYNLPEILSDVKDKVKIISNVKVPPKRQDAQTSQQQAQIVPLESSSEADALNNVATGLATSLNLVDIVVLDDNQQYILRQDGQNEQEFIIPELAHGQPFTGQVITTQDNTVIQQGMIQSSTGDIASTDELVMVLTDHEYPDEQEGENPENSNIVVLYSHPVEGQEGQFITSQGNLMVNSQTGMLEIRNGSTISTTTASQMVVTNSVTSPIESIEMIQREINSQVPGLKQETYFEEEASSKLDQHNEQHTAKLQSMPDLQGISETDTMESQPEIHPPNEDHFQETQKENEEQQEQTEESLNESSELQDEKDTSEDNVDSSFDANATEPMDIEEIEHKTAESEEPEDNCQKNIEEHDLQDTTLDSKPTTEVDDLYSKSTETPQNDEGIDVPPDQTFYEAREVEVNNPLCLGDATHHFPGISEECEPSQEREPSEVEQEPVNQGEPMEVDGKVEDGITEQEHFEEKEAETEIEEEGEHTAVADNNTDGETLHEEPPLEEKEDEVLPQKQEEPEGNEDGLQADKLEDDPQQSSQQEESEKIISNTKNAADINKTILDDWEDDTDSQQSDKNVDPSERQVSISEETNKDNVAAAVENVNKLMDDWDEEDEEERK